MNPMAGPAQDSDRPIALTARGLTKRFPGVVALDAVDFSLRAGEVHALMGENGAGKSTLIKCLTGVYAPDEGEMHLAGERVQPKSPAHAQTLGISSVYQEVNLIPTMSVAENLTLGRQPRAWYGVNRRAMRERARAALGRLELELDVDQRLDAYSIALQQMVAIARALDEDAKVLILDEPTSSLDERETERLFTVMRRLRDDGLAIIFITHFLEQVDAIADRMTVLRNGRLVGTFDAATTSRLDLVRHMLGREIGADDHDAATAAPARRQEAAVPLLEVRELSRRGAVAPVSFSLDRGETLGLAGLLGSGRTEVLRLVFALDRASGGSVHWNGKPIILGQPRQALRAGMAMLTEDRKHDGIVPDLSVRENMILALQAKRGWRRLRVREQRAIAQRFITSLGVRTPSMEQPIRLLSGGNQQKALLARALATEPILLLLDEPTRGIDLGAKAEIEKVINELRAQGLAILFVSAELEEVARLCDRALVLRDRRVILEIARDDLTADRLLRAIGAAEEVAA